MLAAKTIISMIPIAQANNKKLSLLGFVAFFKFTTISLTLFLLTRVIFFKKMKRNSKFLYASSFLNLIVAIIQDFFHIFMLKYIKQF